jgi:hypothetical protein
MPVFCHKMATFSRKIATSSSFLRAVYLPTQGEARPLDGPVPAPQVLAEAILL